MFIVECYRKNDCDYVVVCAQFRTKRDAKQYIAEMNRRDSLFHYYIANP